MSDDATTWFCMFGVDIYDWKDLGSRSPSIPARGCAGMYQCEDGLRPETESVNREPSKFQMTIHWIHSENDAECLGLMKLLSILNCARPVLFANADPRYPYSIGGSSFAVKFRDRHFVVTARHVLRAGGFDASQVRIQYRPNSNSFLPLEQMYWLQGEDQDDTDQFDLAIWRLNDAAVDFEAFGDYLPYNLLGIDSVTLYGGNSHYLFRGYPAIFRKVDYELRDFQLNSISGRAVYVGQGPAAFTREIALVNDGTLASAEGLSGAPVFQVNNDGNGLSITEAFAGVLIRGNSSRAFFLEHRQIIGVLIQICAGNDQSAGSSNPQAEPR